MASVMFTSGLIIDVPATRDQVLTALASASGVATGVVNGVNVSIQRGSVAAVADNATGFVVRYIPPIMPPDPNPA